MVKRPVKQEEKIMDNQSSLEKPHVSGSNLDLIINWMCLVLEKEMPIYEEQYWTPTIDEAAKLFITDKSLFKLFLWVEAGVEADGMKFSFTDPPKLS